MKMIKNLLRKDLKMCKNKDAKMRLLRDMSPLMGYMKSHKNMLQTEQQLISCEIRKRKYVL